MRQAYPVRTYATASPEQAKLQAVFQHFQDEFPLDPFSPFAEFFAKRSHAECQGRGLRTYLRSGNQHAADLRLCLCAEKRRDRFILKALLFDAAKERGGLAFAEGTICAASDLALPTNPRKDLHRALADQPRRAVDAELVAAAVAP